MFAGYPHRSVYNHREFATVLSLRRCEAPSCSEDLPFAVYCSATVQQKSLLELTTQFVAENENYN